MIRNSLILFAALVLIAGLATGCAGFSSRERAAPSTSQSSLTSEPTQPLPADGIKVRFSARDGTELVGYYHPAADPQAPIFLLMHSVNGDHQEWEATGIVEWLQNRSEGPVTVRGFPAMPEDLSFGVFLIDFRGFGESAGNRGEWQPTGWSLDAEAAVRTAGVLPVVDTSLWAEFRSSPVKLPGGNGVALIPAFLPDSSYSGDIPLPIPGKDELFILNAAAAGQGRGSTAPVPIPESDGVRVLPLTAAGPYSATPIEIPGRGVTLVHLALPGQGPLSATPIEIPGQEGSYLLGTNLLDPGPVSGMPIPISGGGEVRIVPVYIDGLDPVSATPIEIPGSGGVMVVPVPIPGPERGSGVPVPMPGGEDLTALPIFIPGLDPVSATPIEIPGSGDVMIVPVPIPGPDFVGTVPLPIPGPAGEVTVEFTKTETDRVSGMPIPIPGGEEVRIAPVYIDGLDPVSATPIEIPGGGKVWVIPLPVPDPDSVGTVPLPIPGGEDLTALPIFIPGLDPVSATPIEIPGAGKVWVIPLPVPDPDSVGTVPLPIPDGGEVQILPVFIPGLDPVSATPIEIPGQEGLIVLGMAPLKERDPRILPVPDPSPGLIGLGASIGADAVVSACDENCIGAISLSPGSWLGPVYSNAVESAQKSDLEIWCAASKGDERAASTCDEAAQAGAESSYYEGDEHGVEMFDLESEQVSPLGQLVARFIRQLEDNQQGEEEQGEGE